MSLSGGLGRRKRLMPTADINVTSLVDVAFVLLIIFMITAPMMQGGVAIELPKAQGRPLAHRSGLQHRVEGGAHRCSPMDDAGTGRVPGGDERHRLCSGYPAVWGTRTPREGLVVLRSRGRYCRPRS